MASFHIHLAVGKRYYEKHNNIYNVEEFYRGIIAPDLVTDKKISHYSGEKRNKENIFEYLANKVLLNKFLEHEKIDTDYQKGVFVHLITDYLFFNDFFDVEYLKNISYEEFCIDLYDSYDKTNQYLIEKYQIDDSRFKEQMNQNIKKDNEEKKTVNKHGRNILPFEKLDEFIEKVSSIDIEQYEEKIRKNNKNVLPY